MKISLFGWVIFVRKHRRFRGSQYAGEQPSEEFKEAFSSRGGGAVRDCSCGRTYFNSDGGWDWGKGEREHLLKKAQTDPDGYRDLPSAVSGIFISSFFFVDGCPCGLAATYERLIKDNARAVADFLDRRAQKQMDEALKFFEEETTFGVDTIVSADEMNQSMKRAMRDKK